MENKQVVQSKNSADKKDESTIGKAINGLNYVDDDISKKLKAINENDPTISYLRKIKFSMNKK